MTAAPLDLDPVTSARRVATVEKYLAQAEDARTRSAELVDGLSALMTKLDLMHAIPLDVLDRYERLIVQAHARNLTRLSHYGTMPEKER